MSLSVPFYSSRAKWKGTTFLSFSFIKAPKKDHSSLKKNGCKRGRKPLASYIQYIPAQVLFSKSSLLSYTAPWLFLKGCSFHFPIRVFSLQPPAIACGPWKTLLLKTIANLHPSLSPRKKKLQLIPYPPESLKEIWKKEKKNNRCSKYSTPDHQRALLFFAFFFPRLRGALTQPNPP